MNQLKTFHHPYFGQVEIVEDEGSIWFGATKAAQALGYSNPHDAISKHCRREGVAKREVLTEGGPQQMNFINEGNLYRLITKSKLPSAERYEKWVFDEVLPSIRKHGAYMTPETIEKTLLNPDFIIQLATSLKEEQQARIAAEQKIALDRPKVVFAEALETSRNSILIGELAKLLKQNGIDIGQNRLFKLLRDEGFLGRRGEYYNIPTQRAMEMRLFEIKTTTINTPEGETKVKRTPKVTGRGQLYFINKFRGALKTS